MIFERGRRFFFSGNAIILRAPYTDYDERRRRFDDISSLAITVRTAFPPSLYPSEKKKKTPRVPTRRVYLQFNSFVASRLQTALGCGPAVLQVRAHLFYTNRHYTRIYIYIDIPTYKRVDEGILFFFFSKSYSVASLFVVAPHRTARIRTGGPAAAAV